MVAGRGFQKQPQSATTGSHGKNLASKDVSLHADVSKDVSLHADVSKALGSRVYLCTLGGSK